MLAGTLTSREVDRLMRHYEGLVFRTAQMLVTGEHPECRGVPVEEDEDDVRQKLRIKVHYMIRRFDPAKVRKPRASGSQRYGSTTAADKSRDAYVNMGVRDCAKDIAKRKRRGEMLIDDIAPRRTADSEDGARDRFDERYLSASAEQTFATVEDETPTLPNTLTRREREVVTLMCQHYRQTEIASMMNVSKRDVESAVRAIRLKLADWRPAAPRPEAVAA